MKKHGAATGCFQGSVVDAAMQGFRTPEEVATFGKLLSGMADIVVHKYNGSLKV